MGELPVACCDLFSFLGLRHHCGWTAPVKLKDTCSLEEKLWQTDSILKSRDITLPTKVHTIKAMVFPVVTYGCKSWTIRRAECPRTDAFELWFWRRLLRVTQTERRSNQSILQEIKLKFSLEGLGKPLQFSFLDNSMDRGAWWATVMGSQKSWTRLSN